MSETDTIDTKNWIMKAVVEKYESDEAYERGDDPVEVQEADGNALLNTGIQKLQDLLIGAGALTAFNNANSRIGVGDSSTAVNVGTDTTLVAATNKYFMTQDGGFPSRTGQTITWKATFASGVAQFAWNEWGIDSGTTASATGSGVMLNRKVQAFGTKGATTWVMTATLVIT